MTASSVSPPSRDLEFDSLLAEYSQLVYRDGVLIQTLLTVVGVAATVLGALFFYLPDYAPHATGLPGNPWIYMAAPMLPVILFGTLVYLTLHINFLAQYTHAVEERIASWTGAELTPDELGVPRAYAASPSFMRLGSRLFGVRAQTRSGMFYAASELVVFFGVGVLLLGVPAWVIRRLPVYVNFLNFLIYTPLIVILVAALVRSLRPNRVLLEDTLTEFRLAPAKIATAIDKRNISLTSYLLFPRGADNVAKVAVGVIGILVGRVALVRATHMQYFTWALLGQVALFALVFELLFYQARYSWNDLRDADDDQQHPEARRRRRIPPEITGEKVVAVLVSIPVRVITGIFAIFAFAPTELRPMLFGLVAVWACAFVYEVLRDRERVGTVSVLDAPRPLVYAIFAVVGCGYAIRVLVGIALGSQGAVSFPIAAIAAATMWLVELSTVAMAWVFEGSTNVSHDSLGTPQDSSYSPRLRKKAHIGYLLAQAGLIDRRSHEAETEYSKANAQTPILALDCALRRHVTVWSVTGAASLIFGSILAVGVANGYSFPSWTTTSTCAAGALVFSCCYLIPELAAPRWFTTMMKGKVKRLPILACSVIAATGTFALYAWKQEMPLWWLGSLLLAFLSGFYEFTRRSSYELVLGWMDGFKEAGKKLRRLPGGVFVWFVGPTAALKLFEPRARRPTANQRVVRWDDDNPRSGQGRTDVQASDRRRPRRRRPPS